MVLRKTELQRIMQTVPVMQIAMSQPIHRKTKVGEKGMIKIDHCLK